ncbi:MAG TPA: hypothetical protein PKD57_14910, partial [Saprospiraceae bacterium]|nr:hypothetical protein [Saprospiraceae bacterium]HND90301.1 hypothetical protein [Anaerolineales bacterium]HNF94780.1 hypothetical protein [Anaerolineales bacterium]HNH03234.1 hypothetical protein [Anaerolineales bacterium]
MRLMNWILHRNLAEAHEVGRGLCSISALKSGCYNQYVPYWGILFGKKDFKKAYSIGDGALR